MKLKHFDRAEVLKIDEDLYFLAIVDKHGRISTMQKFDTQKDAESATDMLYTFLAQDSPNDLTLEDFKKEIRAVYSACDAGVLTADDLENLTTAEIRKKAFQHFN